MTPLLLAIPLLSLVQYGRTQQLLFPAAVPLVVRSPYLGGWGSTNVGSIVQGTWATTSQLGSNSSAC